jgi:hypothetical protein
MQDSSPVFGPMGWFWWPLQLATQALAAFRTGPDTLTQAINPWSAVINVNSNNSAAPETERAVLAKHSYGRQLGRSSDVVALLIRRIDASERPLSGEDRRAIGDFEQMKREIDELKAESARQRVDRLVAEAELLERSDPAAFGELRQRLRGLMADTRKRE